VLELFICVIVAQKIWQYLVLYCWCFSVLL